MPEPKKYRSVYTDKEHRMYSNDPMRQQIAAKYDEPVIPIEEVVVTPKYRTLPQNRFFRRPGETEQQYYSRMATQESITPSFPEKDIIAAQLVGGLASKIAPRLGALSQEEQWKKLAKEMQGPRNMKDYEAAMAEAKKLMDPTVPPKRMSTKNEIKFWMKMLNDVLQKQYGGSMNPVPFALRDENNEFQALK